MSDAEPATTPGPVVTAAEGAIAAVLNRRLATPAPTLVPPKSGFLSTEFYASFVWAIAMALVAMHVVPAADAGVVQSELGTLAKDLVALISGGIAIWKYAHNSVTLKTIFHHAQAASVVSAATAPPAGDPFKV